MRSDISEQSREKATSTQYEYVRQGYSLLLCRNAHSRCPNLLPKISVITGFSAAFGATKQRRTDLIAKSQSKNLDLTDWSLV